jgi:hypothetical protein
MLTASSKGRDAVSHMAAEWKKGSELTPESPFIVALMHSGGITLMTLILLQW